MADSRLEDRIRAAEAEIEGEKHITRHVLEQVRRATAEIAAVRVELTTLSLRFDNLAGTVALAMSALTAHGTQLNILLQDVGSIRQEKATRGDIVAINARLDRMDARFDGMDARLDAELSAIRQEAATRGDVAAINARLDRMDARLDTELSAIRQETATRADIAAINARLDTELSAIRQEAATRHNDVLAAIRALARGGTPQA
jgi:hypothetical protein